MDGGLGVMDLGRQGGPAAPAGPWGTVPKTSELALGIQEHFCWNNPGLGTPEFEAPHHHPGTQLWREAGQEQLLI